MKEDVFAYIDDHKAQMMDLWQDLVNQDSPASYREGVDLVAKRVFKELEEAGASTRWDEEGKALIAEIPGDSRAPVLLLGHMDTVFPVGEAARRPFTVEGSRVTGPGALDMKGGVAVMLSALKALHSAGFSGRPLKVILVSDEEIAHNGSKATVMLQREARGCAACFNCETGYEDNSLVIGRKGGVVFKAAVHGIAAHAGNNPRQGRSAIWEMAKKIDDIQNMTDRDKGITFNVGTIKGGTVSNAIPDYCEVEGDIRFQDPDISPLVKEELLKVLNHTYIEGTKTELLLYHEGMLPMKMTEENRKLFEFVKKTGEENGIPVSEGKLVGGGSDSGYVVYAGVPTVCAMGVKGRFNHTRDEYALKDSLFERAKLLGAVILKMNEV
ncbi:M20 family metallopeptidase [Dialister hominis]|jgi:glutamate carboxypeptidase|uniref:M20 family metallopeptidase n=1 Tax=Dialister hominis TaxID=2582419 RepID=UPI0026738BC1|nr:M20 family metallopeptidase [uncultured Dialister sp.]MCH3913317.1 M20 family metallopeptidase [Dialister sp.]MCH3930194.1 M20 family metallopeptidase [Dialister sp.]MEE1350234.1 M20 family metallopeptidase [Dialister hominis]